MSALALAGLFVLAACAKTTTAGSGVSRTPSPSPSPSPDPAITISTASVPGVGTVLVNGNGQTLYLLTAEQGGTLTCTSAQCLHAWPGVTLTAGEPAGLAGPGATASLLGTVKDAAGDNLVTYGGWPLHTFIGDTGPGTAKGQGIVNFGGTWEVLTAAGSGVTPSPTPQKSPSPASSHAPATVPTHTTVVPTPTHTTAPASSPTLVPPATTSAPQPSYSYGY